MDWRCGTSRKDLLCECLVCEHRTLRSNHNPTKKKKKKKKSVRGTERVGRLGLQHILRRTQFSSHFKDEESEIRTSAKLFTVTDEVSGSGEECATNCCTCLQ
jgi:hypothetical protein